MPDVHMPVQMAPTVLQQPILPNWSFNLMSVNLGRSNDVSVEMDALQRVGSYGRQIGRLSEALEVVIRRLRLLDDDGLSDRERDTLTIFLATVAEVRALKPAKPDRGPDGAGTSRPDTASAMSA